MVVFHFMYLKQACRRMLMQSQWIILFLSSLAQSSEICTFMKSIVCMFSGLATPKLQTSGLTHWYRPFFDLSDTLCETLPQILSISVVLPAIQPSEFKIKIDPINRHIGYRRDNPHLTIQYTIKKTIKRLYLYNHIENFLIYSHC